MDKIKFDPSKNYQWTPETEFTFKGKEYAYILGHLRKRKDELIQELQMIGIYESKLVEAVEKGDATEMVPEAEVVESKV